MHHVEHPAIERHQCDQEQIGKGDSRQLDCNPPLLQVVGEAGRENAHGLRHEQPCQDEQNQLREKQQGEDAIGEQSGRRLAAFTTDMRVGRHERRIECAFRENRPKMIRQAQRHEERIGKRPGAEDRRKHDVAREPSQPGEERVAADGEDTTEHAPLLQHAAALQNGEIRRNIGLRMIFSEDRRPPPDQIRGHAFRDHAPIAPCTALMIRACVGSSR